MQTLDQETARELSYAFNGTDKRIGALKQYNTGLRLWQERPEEVKSLRVFVGWLYPTLGITRRNLRLFAREDWTTEWDKAAPIMRTGHSYRVYIRYTERREFDGIVIMRSDNLTSAGGRVIKMGEVTL